MGEKRKTQDSADKQKDDKKKNKKAKQVGVQPLYLRQPSCCCRQLQSQLRRCGGQLDLVVGESIYASVIS